MSLFNEVLLILCLILLNGFMSLSEMAIVSARKTRLRAQADKGRYNYKLALAASENPGAVLSTIQIGITLVGILIGAIGGATIAEVLEKYFRTIPWLAVYSRAAAIGVLVLATTYLSVVLGELVPKRMALHNPEPLAAAIILPMRILGIVFSPLVRLLTLSTDLVLKLLGQRGIKEPEITDDDVKILVEQGVKAGVFLEAEKEIVHNALYLADQRIRYVMTHRVDIEYLEIDDPKEDIFSKLMNHIEFSVFPVCKNGLDNVVGVVYTKRILTAFLQNSFTRLKDYLEKPVFIPETTNALKALSILREHNSQIAVVIDEYGGLDGLVSLADLSFALVGRFRHGGVIESPTVLRRADGSFLVDGMVSLRTFTEFFKLDDLGSREYTTVAGLVLDLLGHIPKAGESLVFQGLKIEVVDMDANRIDELLVTRQDPEIPPITFFD